jgi:hypothetical protein
MIWLIRLVLTAGQKLVLDSLDNVAAEVGRSGCIDKVFLELSDKLVAPRCTELAAGTGEVQSRIGCTADRYQSQRRIGVPERRLVTSHN